VRSQQTAEPDFFRWFLREPHEGTFPMWQLGHSKVRFLYSGLWGSIRAGIIIVPHFGQDGRLVAIRSRGREPETEHVALLSRAGRYYLGLLP
jgi:hypothetical protein